MFQLLKCEEQDGKTHVRISYDSNQRSDAERIIEQSFESKSIAARFIDNAARTYLREKLSNYVKHKAVLARTSKSYQASGSLHEKFHALDLWLRLLDQTVNYPLSTLSHIVIRHENELKVLLPDEGSDLYQQAKNNLDNIIHLAYEAREWENRAA